MIWSRRRGRVASRGAVAIALASLCGGCGGVLDPRGPVGSANKLILLNSLAIMLSIVVPTVFATLAFAWWYRSGNKRAVRHPTFVHSGRIELIVWSIPLLTILLLGSIAWIGSHDLDPGAPLQSDRKPVEVQVVSLDWKWLFIYPEQGVASVNRLVVPAGTPVRLSLTSASVLNAFFVPQLGSMIYTMNGMTTKLNLMADKPGSFYGQSSHYSGDGFSDMHFMVDAMSPEGFGSWVTATKQAGATLDEKAYAELAKQSTKVPPTTFRGVASGLYDAIVSQKLTPGPGPADGEPSPPVHPKQEG